MGCAVFRKRSAKAAMGGGKSSILAWISAHVGGGKSVSIFGPSGVGWGEYAEILHHDQAQNAEILLLTCFLVLF
jgi:ABC-type nitrate/sulfonate/bicarbonate transport system ATPase subunit